MRPSLDITFLQVAKVLAQRSTCARVKVGGVLVSKDGKIISSAWNGVAAGQKHCEDHFSEEDRNSEFFYGAHGEWSRDNELHAEQNLIIYPDKNEMKGGTIYLTISPCRDCAKLIIASGVSRVVFEKPYDRDISGINILRQNGVDCECVTE